MSVSIREKIDEKTKDVPNAASSSSSSSTGSAFLAAAGAAAACVVQRAKGNGTSKVSGQSTNTETLQANGCPSYRGIAGWGSSCCCRGTTTADVKDEAANVLATDGLGEEAGPEGLKLNVGGLQQSRDLLTLQSRQERTDRNMQVSGLAN